MNNITGLADINNVMLNCGTQCLHPGGLEKTDEMLQKCGIAADKKVLELGCGKGITALHIAKKYKCRVTGIDQSQDMIAEARIRAKDHGLQDKLLFIQSTVNPIPFPDESFDIIIAECVTTLLDTEKIFSEIFRVLKTGGKTGDIEMMWKTKPAMKVIRGLAELWDGFHTYTEEEWKSLLEKRGFSKIALVDFSIPLSEMESRMFRNLGATGIMKLSYKLMSDPPLRRALYAYWRVFRDYEENFAYAYLVGEKPRNVNRKA